MILSHIAAIAKNKVIGVDGDLPWDIPEDMKFFRTKTSGHIIVMGRKTFESFPKPLPNRTSIVVSRSGYEHEGAVSTGSLEEAVELAKAYISEANDNEIMVIGGAQIYKLALPIANRIYLTRVHQEPEGDAFFPEFGAHWLEKDIDRHDGFSFVTLERG